MGDVWSVSGCALGLALASVCLGCDGPSVDADAAARADASDGSSGDDAGPATGTRIVASEGGLVESADGLFRIYVSPGALAEDATISIERVAAADVPADVAAAGPISAVYAVEPDGLTFGGDGAWGHFVFAAAPSGLITGSPPEYSSVQVSARPRDGGAITDHSTSFTSYDAQSTALDVVARLEHLSYQFARNQGLDLIVDLGAPEQPVGGVWAASGVLVLAPRRWLNNPVTTMELWSNSDSPVTDELYGGEVRPQVDADVARALRGLNVRVPPDASRRELGAPPGSSDPVAFVSPGPSWGCERAGDGGRAGIGVKVNFPPYVWTLVYADQGVRCLDAVAYARVVEEARCRREDAAVVCDPPQPVAEVTPSSPARTVVTTGNTFVVVTPETAPDAMGPPEIVATSGTSTMTATPDGAGGYTTGFVDPESFGFGGDIAWSASGYTGSTAPPAPLPVRFGALEGLDTDLVFDAEPMGQVTLRVRIPGIVACGDSGNYRNVELVRHLSSTDLGGGARGADAPVRSVLEDLARHCGITYDELAARPIVILVSTSTQSLLQTDGGLVVLSSERSIRIDDSTTLTATCPTGRIWCTDRCVDPGADPFNCGGCGRQPEEICDGADNDCDFIADETCPRRVDWFAADRAVSPDFGGATGGDSNATAGCAYFNPLIGVCGTHNMDGSLHALRPVCGIVNLVEITDTIPYRYALVVSEVLPGGSPCESLTGGGSSGGTPWSARCPVGMVVEGISGQAGTNVGQIQLHCAQWGVRRDVIGDEWQIFREAGAMSPVGGSGPGSAFGPWLIPDDVDTGNAAAVRSIYFRYALGTNGAVIRVSARGRAPSLLR